MKFLIYLAFAFFLVALYMVAYPLFRHPVVAPKHENTICSGPRQLTKDYCLYNELHYNPPK